MPSRVTVTELVGRVVSALHQLPRCPPEVFFLACIVPTTVHLTFLWMPNACMIRMEHDARTGRSDLKAHLSSSAHRKDSSGLLLLTV